MAIANPVWAVRRIATILIRAPLAAMAAINAAKNPDQHLSAEEIDDILHKDS